MNTKIQTILLFMLLIALITDTVIRLIQLNVQMELVTALTDLPDAFEITLSQFSEDIRNTFTESVDGLGSSVERIFGF